MKPYEARTQQQDDIESEDDKSEGEHDEEDKKKRKKQVKQEKREKRKLKKELKLAFKSQNTKLAKAATTEIGALKTGVSVKKIYWKQVFINILIN